MSQGIMIMGVGAVLFVLSTLWAMAAWRKRKKERLVLYDTLQREYWGKE